MTIMDMASNFYPSRTRRLFHPALQLTSLKTRTTARQWKAPNFIPKPTRGGPFELSRSLRECSEAQMDLSLPPPLYTRTVLMSDTH